MKTKTQNQKSGLKNRSEQLSTGNRPQINFARRLANRSLNTENLLGLLHREVPRFYSLAEVVGKWVWVQFNEIPAPEIRQQLAQLGFHWNRTRQAWQHPCGLYREQAAMIDPHQKYRSYFPADMKPV